MDEKRCILCTHLKSGKWSSYWLSSITDFISPQKMVKQKRPKIPFPRAKEFVSNSKI